MIETENRILDGNVYIETYGCQMNRADSELVMSMLEEVGYNWVENPDEAAVILVNTCAVREHASEKAITNISQLKKYKEQNKNVRIGILGCLSTHLGEILKERLPFLDWILGPDAYRTIPNLLQDKTKKKTLLNLYGLDEELYDDLAPSRREGVNAWVTISRGCSNHCTYCVVPRTRGPVRYRPKKSILEEVESAISQGFSQITLLGQNVNSWVDDSCGFPGLMREVAAIPGLKRLRFMSSHPKDISDELFEVLGSGLPVCPELHLAMQSGSDRILKHMNRKYTGARYLKIMTKARRKAPEIFLSTDIIVGFPGETEEDFKETEKLVREIGFDEAFVYKYSERLHTPASKLKDDVPEDVKVERLQIINEIIRESGRKKRESQIGQIMPILIEGESTKNPDEKMGRTPGGHIVVVPGDFIAGSEINVKIEELRGFTLRGKAVTSK